MVAPDGPATATLDDQQRSYPAAGEPQSLGAALLQIPAEVDLLLADLVAGEGQDLGIPEARAVGARGLVGHDDLVAGLDQADDLERLDLPGARPAAIEEA